MGSLILYSLLNRSPLELTVQHDRNPLLVNLSDGQVRNGYNITILNKTHNDQIYKLTLKNLDNATLHIQSGQEIAPDNLSVSADSVGHFKIFITAGKQAEARKEIEFEITMQTTNIADKKNSIFVSREK